METKHLAIKEFANALGLESRFMGDEDLTDSLEIHFHASPSAKTLTDTMKGLIELGVIDAGDAFRLDQKGTINMVLLRPSLKVDGSFWRKKAAHSTNILDGHPVGDLHQEVKLMALAMLTTVDYRLPYHEEIPSRIDTFGPIIPGGWLSGNNGWADLWNATFMGPSEISTFDSPFNGFVSTFRNYHLIGNALNALLQEEESVLDKKLEKIVQSLTNKIKEIFLTHEAFRALSDAPAASWEKGNWKNLRKILVEIEQRKDNVVDTITVDGKEEPITMASYMKMLLFLATHKITKAVLRDYADKLKKGDHTTAEIMKKLSIAARQAGVYDDKEILKIVLKLLGDNDDNDDDDWNIFQDGWGNDGDDGNGDNRPSYGFGLFPESLDADISSSLNQGLSDHDKGNLDDSADPPPSNTASRLFLFDRSL